MPSITDTPPYQIMTVMARAARNSTTGVSWLCWRIDRTVALKLFWFTFRNRLVS